MTKTVSLGMDEWNPFEEDNFGNETEDSIFGKEFDKLRRGSNSSKCFWFLLVSKINNLCRDCVWLQIYITQCTLILACYS